MYMYIIHGECIKWFSAYKEMRSPFECVCVCVCTWREGLGGIFVEEGSYFSRKGRGVYTEGRCPGIPLPQLKFLPTAKRYIYSCPSIIDSVIILILISISKWKCSIPIRLVYYPDIPHISRVSYRIFGFILLC